MEKIKVVTIMTFLLMLVIGVYISFSMYQHRIQMVQLEIVKNNRVLVTTVEKELKDAWYHYLKELIALKSKVVHDRPNSIFQALQMIEGSHNEIERAFYFTHDMIYLRQWSKRRKHQQKEPFDIGIMDFTEFRAAEILEFRDHNYTEAVKMYEQLWLQNPDDHYATNALARCLFKQNNFERALKLYRQIYKQNPEPKTQSEIPLGLTAGLQMVNIYEQMGNTREASGIGLEIYTDMLDSKWTLSEARQKIYVQKIKDWLQSLINNDDDRKKYQQLQSKERLLTANKQFTNRIESKIIPYTEGSYSRAYYVYFNQEEEMLKKFWLIIPHHDNYLIVVMDFELFLQQALSSTIAAIEQRNIEIGIANNTRPIKTLIKSKQIASVFTIDENFPELEIRIAPTRTVTEMIMETTQKIKQQHLIISFIAAVIIMMFFVVFYNQIKLAERKTDFVSQLSHELKTPLTSLRAFSELIEDQPELAEKKIRQYATFMQYESMRLARLIENLLDITRIEKKKLSYDFQPCLLKAIIEEAIEIFKQVNKELLQEVKLICRDDGCVMVDKDAFIRVILNLLDNAKKYSHPTGKIDVQIKAVTNKMVVEVEDQGVGMNGSEIRNVFKKYYQAKRTYEEKYKGVGLGLAIVRTIVRAHQGRISIKSQINQGTCVSITLPRVKNKVD